MKPSEAILKRARELFVLDAPAGSTIISAILEWIDAHGGNVPAKPDAYHDAPTDAEHTCILQHCKLGNRLKAACRACMRERAGRCQKSSSGSPGTGETPLYIPTAGEWVKVVAIAPFDALPAHGLAEYRYDATESTADSHPDWLCFWSVGKYGGTWCRVEPVCQCGASSVTGRLNDHDPNCKWLKWVESHRAPKNTALELQCPADYPGTGGGSWACIRNDGHEGEHRDTRGLWIESRRVAPVVDSAVERPVADSIIRATEGAILEPGSYLPEPNYDGDSEPPFQIAQPLAAQSCNWGPTGFCWPWRVGWITAVRRVAPVVDPQPVQNADGSYTYHGVRSDLWEGATMTQTFYPPRTNAACTLEYLEKNAPAVASAVEPTTQHEAKTTCAKCGHSRGQHFRVSADVGCKATFHGERCLCTEFTEQVAPVVEPVGEPTKARTALWSHELQGELDAAVKLSERYYQERDTALADVERLETEKRAGAWHEGWRIAVKERDEYRASLATVERERDERRDERDGLLNKLNAAHREVARANSQRVMLEINLGEQLSTINTEADRLRSELETAQQRLAEGVEVMNARQAADREEIARLKGELASAVPALDVQKGLVAKYRAHPPPGDPIPMFLTCPKCNTRHIDAGEFATRSHHTHSCQDCGLTWRPAVAPTVGVEFLPGFKNDQPAPPSSETVGGA